ncbi:MAG: hypothetical protein JWQ79_3168 [Mucilaginibacter sp.]|nr:hypothetical protein [Mucilaginibacter sp.]
MADATNPEEVPGKTFGMNDKMIELLKWFITSVVLVVAAGIITHYDNESKLELEKVDTDSRLITAISTKFDTLASTQYSYLKFIQPFVTSPDLQEPVKLSIERLEKLVKQQTFQSPKADVPQAATANQNKLTAPQTKALQDLAGATAGAVPTTQIKPLSDAIQAENNVVKDNPALTSIDAKAISNIEAATVILNPIKNDNLTLVGPPQTLWCKKGYYVEYNNTLRVGLSNLDAGSQTITVDLTDITSTPTTFIRQNMVLNVSKTETVDRSPYQYKITLNYIGAAGKNPFTKAGYITVATYKKNP